jgi:hypothetical protein
MRARHPFRITPSRSGRGARREPRVGAFRGRTFGTRRKLAGRAR